MAAGGQQSPGTSFLASTKDPLPYDPTAFQGAQIGQSPSSESSWSGTSSSSVSWSLKGGGSGVGAWAGDSRRWVEARQAMHGGGASCGSHLACRGPGSDSPSSSPWCFYRHRSALQSAAGSWQTKPLVRPGLPPGSFTPPRTAAQAVCPCCTHSSSQFSTPSAGAAQRRQGLVDIPIQAEQAGTASCRQQNGTRHGAQAVPGRGSGAAPPQRYSSCLRQAHRHRNHCPRHLGCHLKRFEEQGMWRQVGVSDETHWQTWREQGA